MAGGISVLTEAAWVRRQAAFDVIEAMTAADSVSFNEFDADGGNPEYHRSAEKVAASLDTQTHIRGKITGAQATLVRYIKPRGLTAAPDDVAMLKHAMGRMQAFLTVVAFGSGALDTIGILVDGTLVGTMTEGTDFSAATSNTVTAANIAAAVPTFLAGLGTPIRDVFASSSGDVVTVYSDDHEVTLTSGDLTAWTPTGFGFAFNRRNPLGLQVERVLGDEYEGFVYQVLSGLWVESIDIAQAGNEEGTITYNCGFSRMGYLKGLPRTDATGYTGVGTVALTTASGGKIRPGVRVQFVRRTDGVVEDNGGAGYLVTDASETTSGDTVTAATMSFTPNLAAPLTAAEYDVRPLTPAHSIGGTIQGGTQGTTTIAGTDLDETEETNVSITTGIKGVGNDQGSDRITRIRRTAARETSIEATWVTEDAVTQEIGLGWDGHRRSFALRQGPDTAGSRMRTTCPQVLFAVAKQDVGDEGEVMMTAAGLAEQSAAANDSTVIAFD